MLSTQINSAYILVDAYGVKVSVIFTFVVRILPFLSLSLCYVVSIVDPIVDPNISRLVLGLDLYLNLYNNVLLCHVIPCSYQSSNFDGRSFFGAN